MTEPIDLLRAAAAEPFECHPECKCLCHDDEVEDPGPTHLATCAWADPTFPEYLWAPDSPSTGEKSRT